LGIESSFPDAWSAASRLPVRHDQAHARGDADPWTGDGRPMEAQTRPALHVFQV